MYSQNQGSYGSPAKQARRNSPIHHQKSPSYAHRYQQETPSQITTKKEPTQLLRSSQSPEKLNEGDLLRHKISQLETQLYQAKTDVELSRFQNSKAPRTDSSQLDQLFQQNQALLQENDNLNKTYSQKKTEVDIWKNKYETQMNTLIQLKANYEMDIQKIQRDNETLKSQIDSLSKNLDLENRQIKQSLHEEGKERIDFIKATHAKNTQLYEEQLRKMKDIIEDREKEIYEVTLRLSNSKQNAECENKRINEDRDRLREKVAQLEFALQQELDGQKQKLEQQAELQRHSLKQLHLNELEVLQTESAKVRDLLEVKNEEIQALINQNRYQKQNYEKDSNELKEEVQNLQDKIYEINKIKEEEINDLKEKLATLHITDIQEMKLRNDSLVQKLSKENRALKELIDSKSEELDNQIKEKLQQRESYNQELDRLKQQIEKQRSQHTENEEDKRQELVKSDMHLKQIQQDHELHTEQLNDHINFLEKELDGLKQLLTKKNNETDMQLARSTTIKNNQDEDIRLLRKENDEWKRAFENLEYEKEKIIEEYKARIQDMDHSHTDLRRTLESKGEYLENELNKASESIRYGGEESNNMMNIKRQLEGEIRKLNREIDELKEQMVNLERQKAQELDELRRKLENSNQATVSTIKSSHQNQQRLSEEEIDNLKRIIDQKDREIQDMIQKYETLEVAFSEFQQNHDRLEDYEKKLQLLGSEIVSTKNLYDVFVKTKSRFSSGKKQQQQQQYQ